MSKGHYTAAGASLEFGSADCLFPVAELNAAVHQYRDAQLMLDGVDGERVIVVAPTNLASSYRLTQHALTAIPVETLPSTVRDRIADSIDAPLETFELIQIGKWNTSSSNHSLAEFGDA